MPRRNDGAVGARKTIWILKRHFKMWRELENRSEFVQICLDNATDIMAWAILKHRDPQKYHINHTQSPEEIQAEFNRQYPPNKLTAIRQKKEWQTPSQTLPDVLL